MHDHAVTLPVAFIGRAVARRAGGALSGATMKNLLLLLAAVTLAGCAAVSPLAPQDTASSTESWYWWLHPKLGMVKVDRATNAIVVKAQRDSAQTRTQ
jgi:hypothetical protein